MIEGDEIVGVRIVHRHLHSAETDDALVIALPDARVLKAPEVTRRNRRLHFIPPLQERVVEEVGHGLQLEGASAADLVKIMSSDKIS